MKTYQMLVDGAWVAAESGKTLAVMNPATGEIMARVPEAEAADVDKAVRAARRAFDEGWRDVTAQERGRILFRLAEQVRKDLKALAELETLNSGKPLAESEYDVTDVATCFEYYGGLATKLHGEVLNVPDNALSLALREPLGVAGQIIPWNYPLLMAAWKIAPAICAGCTRGDQARGADAAHAAGAGALVRGLRRAEGRDQHRSPASGRRRARRWWPIPRWTRSRSRAASRWASGSCAPRPTP